MVGKRGIFGRTASFASGKSNNNDDDGGDNYAENITRGAIRRRAAVDLESGHGPDHDDRSNYNGIVGPRGHPYPNKKGRPKPSVFRFQDVARTALEDKRRDDLKKALLRGIDRPALERYRKSPEELKAMRNKKVRAFYEEQNERLNDWLEVDTVVMAIADDVLESMDPDPDHDGDHERHGGLQEVRGEIGELLPDDEKTKRRKANRRAGWAININVIANVLLLVGKIVAAAGTGSLSLAASTVDSALDLLCTLIIWSTNRVVAWRLDALKRRFPVGRRRLEPLGIVVFSIIMVLSFAQILQESVQKLAPLEGETEALSNTAVAALLATIVVKGIIGLGCWRIKGTQVQALAQDCKTDVIFNTLSLLFPFVGYAANVWWLDPAGAALLSLFIIYDWGHTCFSNITRLSGEAASPQTMQRLMFLAHRFSPVVDGFKNVTAYHAGDGVWVEFDLLFVDDDEKRTTLHHCHDVSETLQYCAEALYEVDRCFVSCDYSSSGPIGHASDAERNH